MSLTSWVISVGYRRIAEVGHGCQAWPLAAKEIMGDLLIAGLLVIAGCSMGTAPANSVATVETYFFPLQNGLVYRYSRFISGPSKNTYDTVVGQLVIGQTMADKNALVDTSTGNVLFYLGFTHDANNNLAATLSTGDTTLLALDGLLEDSATWVADPVHQIHATVLARYDDYYLEGRAIHFPDVIMVRYHHDGADESVYTLRFFASGYGLIREVEMAGSNTEISSLQLLSVQYPS